jgi:hypothetical protein
LDALTAPEARLVVKEEGIALTSYVPAKFIPGIASCL